MGRNPRASEARSVGSSRKRILRFGFCAGGIIYVVSVCSIVPHASLSQVLFTHCLCFASASTFLAASLTHIHLPFTSPLSFFSLEFAPFSDESYAQQFYLTIKITLSLFFVFKFISALNCNRITNELPQPITILLFS